MEESHSAAENSCPAQRRQYRLPRGGATHTVYCRLSGQVTGTHDGEQTLAQTATPRRLPVAAAPSGHPFVWGQRPWLPSFPWSLLGEGDSAPSKSSRWRLAAGAGRGRAFHAQTAGRSRSAPAAGALPQQRPRPAVTLGSSHPSATSDLCSAQGQSLTTCDARPSLKIRILHPPLPSSRAAIRDEPARGRGHALRLLVTHRGSTSGRDTASHNVTEAALGGARTQPSSPDPACNCVPMSFHATKAQFTADAEQTLRGHRVD